MPKHDIPKLLYNYHVVPKFVHKHDVPKFIKSQFHAKTNFEHNARFVDNVKFVPTCHFCGIKGYIKPNGYKLK